MLYVLLLLAVGLTCTMIATKQSLLGFPSAIFWAIAGGYSYSQSTALWDIYYFIAIASLLGMTIFCVLGMYALREKRDSYGDESMERSDGQFIDEGKNDNALGSDKAIDAQHSQANGETDSDAWVVPSRQSEAIKKRAEERRKYRRIMS